MKITIEHYKIKYSYQIRYDDIELTEVLRIIKDLLVNAGYIDLADKNLIVSDKRI